MRMSAVPFWPLQQWAEARRVGKQTYWIFRRKQKHLTMKKWLHRCHFNYSKKRDHCFSCCKTQQFIGKCRKRRPCDLQNQPRVWEVYIIIPPCFWSRNAKQTSQGDHSIEGAPLLKCSLLHLFLKMAESLQIATSTSLTRQSWVWLVFDGKPPRYPRAETKLEIFIIRQWQTLPYG